MSQVINCTKIKSSKTFEDKILKFFPKTDDRDVYLYSVGMRRKGTGSYEIYLDIFIGRFQRMTFTQHTNSSPLWDWYTDVEAHERVYQNWAKATVLDLLEEGQEQITEFFYEEELEANI